MLKTAARKVVVVEKTGRVVVLGSLVKAVAYLASLGAIPASEVERMVRDRAGLINGVRVYYH